MSVKCDIEELVDFKTNSAAILPYSKVKPKSTIVIDNGSYACRSGWSGTSKYEPCIEFESVVAKYQSKTDKSITYELGTSSSASVPKNSVRVFQKSAFDQYLPYQFESLEIQLDGIFSLLGINKHPINHNIVLTEPLFYPHQLRSQMTELLFENYGFPNISYGIDSLFSYYFNKGVPKSDSLIISMGNHTTSVIPIIGGKVEQNYIKRLSVGGYHMSTYLLRLMQLKYPNFPLKMNLHQAKATIMNYSYVPTDYMCELRSFENLQNMIDKTITLQFPYTKIPEEGPESDVERQNEKKKMMSDKMKQRIQKNRELKLEELRKEMQTVENILDGSSHLTAEYKHKSKKELEGILNDLESRCLEISDKMSGIIHPQKTNNPLDNWNFDLLDVPDKDLNKEELKEKRKLKLIKASIDSKAKLKAEREYQRKLELEEKEKESSLKLENPQAWLQKKLQIWKDLKVKKRIYKEKQEEGIFKRLEG